MHILSSAGLLGALQVCSYIGDATAKPLGTVLELRIPKGIALDDFASSSAPILSIRESFLNDRDALAISDYQPNSTTISVVESLMAMQRQKREAQLFKKREAFEKRQTFGGRGGNKCDKKKKYKLCDGIYKMFWNAVTKSCETCKPGQEPTPKADKCVDPETPEDEKNRGKCPMGMKLDPNVPGQDNTTKNPKCVPKDQQNRCPGGQSESTPTKSKPSTCAPDDEPDKKCDNTDQYVHKDVGPDGKMKNSCRLTKDNEKKKSYNVNDKMKVLKDKVMGPKYDAEKDKRKRENKARGRRAACLAIGAMTFLPEPDLDALGELELEGLIEPEDDSHAPDIDIKDYMVTIAAKTVVVANVEMETAGPNFGALIKALVRAFKGGAAGGAAATRPTIPLQKGARLFGGKKYDGAVGNGSNRFANLRGKTDVLTGKRAQTGAKEAASKSDAVKNILKSKEFQECLAVGAGVAVGQATTKRQESSNKYTTEYGGGSLTLTIDLDAPEKNNYPSPEDNSNILLLVADPNTDAGEDETPDAQLKTYQDGYNRSDRLNYEGCGKIPFSDQVTLLQTWNGCCKYYNGDNCQPETGLFKQTDREDGELRGDHNDAVSSYWCSFDPNCAGAPGG